MNRWTLIIDDVTPSANVYTRKHWRWCRRQSEKWAWLLHEAGVGFAAKADGKRRVTIFRVHPRAIDRDNAWTPAGKLIVDNLTKFGIIKDDSDKWADVRVIPVHAHGEQPRTIVIIEEMRNS